ncbi:MAG: hypothetical protein C0599_17740 [Salinivirgaceae bacterium]|nr:MAG: hypothetical protein C0599_17740 [Salinivirgaceae bacterium]
MKQTVIIACSIFKNELNNTKNLGTIDIIYLDSMLHMVPDKLENSLTRLIDKYKKHNIILLYGECYPGITELEKNSNVYRVPGINCINITLENKHYKKLRKDGAFILLNEWLKRWKEVFQEELGFKNSANATAFMQEMHSKVVYLDTGNEEIPFETLKEISNYVGLPYSIEKTNAIILEDEINKAINYFKHAS